VLPKVAFKKKSPPVKGGINKVLQGSFVPGFRQNALFKAIGEDPVQTLNDHCRTQKISHKHNLLVNSYTVRNKEGVPGNLML
jgi:hypothetical protein